MKAASEKELIKKISTAKKKVYTQIKKTIIGQGEIIDQILYAVFSKGHCLIIGVPGLAKTLLIKTLASTLDLNFSRIQFTPDLMPSDITGTDIIEEAGKGKREYRFFHGPVFANVILADEINRTPPKTQSALLQAMQEKTVTVGTRTYKLDLPFFVLATQNPIEQEGTYPLPEAQLDRFMFSINIKYPELEEEKEIVKLTTVDTAVSASKVLSKKDILSLQELILKVPASDFVINYSVKLVRMTRPDDKFAPSYIKKWINWGAGPRASQFLILGAKARALLNGRFAVSREDIDSVAYPVLRHRIITNFSAESENVNTDDIITKLLNELKSEKGKN